MVTLDCAKEGAASARAAAPMAYFMMCLRIVWNIGILETREGQPSATFWLKCSTGPRLSGPIITRARALRDALQALRGVMFSGNLSCVMPGAGRRDGIQPRGLNM